ncbi:hypothetical protein [Streptomyces sp. NBC_01439]|uniref:hypothetical protein n=1 Tax=Streptomyces sp. NBC_01439 TaxID=2903867 RepID=UPI002E2BEFA5|nr:hypothetical protein [Streptomyces sp. NBC_01439]
MTVYRASTVKRTRRTKAQLQAFHDAIHDIAAEHQPCSGRQIYYRAVVAGLIDKDSAGSRKNESTVGRALNDMREAFIDCDTLHDPDAVSRIVAGLELGQPDKATRDRELYRYLRVLPMWWITDDTRARHRNSGHRDKDAALAEWHRQYRRDLWQTQTHRVEVWCESSSLAAVLLNTCEEYGVDLYPCRGQAGKGFLWGAAQNYPGFRKPVVALYVGDFDPAGLDIGDSAGERLRRYMPRGEHVDFEFRRIGVTAQQVHDMQLPGHGLNPKIPAAKRARFFDLCDQHGIPHEAVEAEAMEPNVIRQLLADAIREYIDPVQWRVQRMAEESEKRDIWSWRDQPDEDRH